VNFSFVDPSVPNTAGAMISTADDETIWASQLTENKFRLLSPEIQQQRVTEVVRGEVAGIPALYGLGIYYMRSLLNDSDMLGHAGSIYGYTSAVFHRTDTNTDYSANVAAFFLTDQFSAPVVVWLLDRNVWGAINAHGNCGDIAAPSAGDLTCSGASVRQSALILTGGSLTLLPSGSSYNTYVPPASSGDPIPNAQTPVPTLAFYNHELAGVDVRGPATLSVQAGAALSTAGNGSAAITLSGAGSTIDIAGLVTAAGFKVAGLRDSGTGNKVTVSGDVTSSIVWWNPDLPPLAGSTSVVAKPGDDSAAFDLAGNGGTLSGDAANLTVSGLIRTQRIGTAAVQVRPGSKGYVLSIAPNGKVIGPMILAGDDSSLAIAHGGTALYVTESAALAPHAELAQLKIRRPAQVQSLGAPGMPAVSGAAALASQQLSIHANLSGGPTAAPTAPGTEKLEAARAQPQRVPPLVIGLAGRGNKVEIGGTVIAALRTEDQTDYTQALVAIEDKGTENRLVITPTGLVIGDIVISGQHPQLQIDGTVQGNVTLTDQSATIAGAGTIKGTLTIAGERVSKYGNLHLNPVQ
jgi:hypothetical protein